MGGKEQQYIVTQRNNSHVQKRNIFYIEIEIKTTLAEDTIFPTDFQVSQPLYGKI